MPSFIRYLSYLEDGSVGVGCVLSCLSRSSRFICPGVQFVVVGLCRMGVNKRFWEGGVHPGAFCFYGEEFQMCDLM